MSKERKAGAPYEVLGFEPGTVHERFMKLGKVTIVQHNDDGSFMAHLPGPYNGAKYSGPRLRFVRKLVLVREDGPAKPDMYNLVGLSLVSADGRISHRQDVDGDHVPLHVFRIVRSAITYPYFKSQVLDYVSFVSGIPQHRLAVGFQVETGESPLPACGFDRLGLHIYARGAGWNMTWRKV